MKKLDKFNMECINNFKLYTGILKNDGKFSIVGILIKNEIVREYCETIEMSDYDKVLELYNIFNENKVFPNHFYNVMDDMYY